MSQLELDNNGRFLHWDTLIAQANAAFKQEQALIYESLRELSRNQRIIYTRTAQATGQKAGHDDGTYCDIIEAGNVVLGTTKMPNAMGEEEEIPCLESHDAFGLVLRVQTDESGKNPPLEYGSVRFEHIGENTQLPVTNLDQSEDARSADRQIIEGMHAAMRGNDNLSFMYTPYVMMLTRLISVDLDNVHLAVDEQDQTFKMEAVAGEYKITTEFDLGKVRDYFNL